MPEIAFNGLFKVIAMRLVTPGNWYVGFRSKASGKLFAVLDDPTGTGELRVGGDGTFEVETPETGSIERFSGGDLLVFQAATARLEEPVEESAHQT
ncbi:MAG: hypothetical protein JOZ16_16295 [Methylobacteriaceae bacterium]|nr:hypothetical protein [Methylobacteriaceae bacterium]